MNSSKYSFKKIAPKIFFSLQKKYKNIKNNLKAISIKRFIDNFKSKLNFMHIILINC